MTSKSEYDEFWDLSKLVPSKKKSVNSKPVRNTPSQPVDIVVASTNNNDATKYSDTPLNNENVIKRYVSDESAKKEASALLEYSPENSLLHSVKIYRFDSSYNYYEQFCRYAEKFYSVEGKECEHQPFFSYVPQYDQLNRAQLEFYFWWRSQVRRGIYIDADYSYILLFVFETINLVGEHDYAQLRDILTGVWLAYRDKYVRLDKLMSEWIFDFCLIHKLTPPKGKIPLYAIQGACGVAEFFVSALGNDIDKYVNAILVFCSSYDYKKSKFYNGEYKEIYDRYVASALKIALSELSDSGKVFAQTGYSDSKLNRQAYVGALCSYASKRRIEIEFCSFSRSHELRYLVGDIIKFTENIIRSYIGVRSKLSVYSITPRLAELISEHLKNELPPKKKVSAKEVSSTEFDNLYEPTNRVLSLENAKRIEEDSWNTTKMLAEAFEEDNKAQNNMSIENEILRTDSNPKKDEQSDFVSHLGGFEKYLIALMQGDRESVKKAIEALSLSEESAVDKINEIAVDYFGDIILEDGDNGYTVIEDYYDDVLAMFDR